MCLLAPGVSQYRIWQRGRCGSRTCLSLFCTSGEPMALAEFLEQLDELAAAAVPLSRQLGEPAALEAARVEYLGAKNGRLKVVQKSMGSVRRGGSSAGRQTPERSQDADRAGVHGGSAATGIAGSGRGVRRRPSRLMRRCPVSVLRLGRLHPITQTIEELKDIMGRLGFSVADGPEIEDEWHNFEALEHSAGASGTRSAGQLLSAGGRRRWWCACCCAARPARCRSA